MNLKDEKKNIMALELAFLQVFYLSQKKSKPDNSSKYKQPNSELRIF